MVVAANGNHPVPFESLLRSCEEGYYVRELTFLLRYCNGHENAFFQSSWHHRLPSTVLTSIVGRNFPVDRVTRVQYCSIDYACYTHKTQMVVHAIRLLTTACAHSLMDHISDFPSPAVTVPPHPLKRTRPAWGAMSGLEAWIISGSDALHCALQEKSKMRLQGMELMVKLRMRAAKAAALAGSCSHHLSSASSRSDWIQLPSRARALHIRGGKIGERGEGGKGVGVYNH